MQGSFVRIRFRLAEPILLNLQRESKHAMMKLDGFLILTLEGSEYWGEAEG
jgi:hypothetical protein